jgi:hypothetical protein
MLQASSPKETVNGAASISETQPEISTAASVIEEEDSIMEPPTDVTVSNTQPTSSFPNPSSEILDMDPLTPFSSDDEEEIEPTPVPAKGELNNSDCFLCCVQSWPWTRSWQLGFDSVRIHVICFSISASFKLLHKTFLTRHLDTAALSSPSKTSKKVPNALSQGDYSILLHFRLSSEYSFSPQTSA